MTRPTDYPEWASGGSASIEEPTEGKKDLGWEAEEIPPETWFNWLGKTTYDWIVYLDSGGGYDTLDEAVAGMAVGDVAMVREYSATDGPLEHTWEVDLTGSGDTGCKGHFVVTDGLYVYSTPGNSTVFIARDRMDGSTVWTSPTFANAISALATDGEYVYAALTTGKIHCVSCSTHLEITSGSWPYDRGSTDNIHDMYADGTGVFWCGARDTVTPATHGMINRTTGASVWIKDHGAAVNAIRSDGEFVWIAGAVGTSSATLRKLIHDTGVSDADFTVSSTELHGLAISDDCVFYAGVDDGTDNIRCLAKCLTYTNVWAVRVGYTADTVRGLAYDGRYLYAVRSEPTTGVDAGVTLLVINPVNGETIHRFAHGTGTGNIQGSTIDCDGFAIFVGTDDAGGSPTRDGFHRHETRQKPAMVVRTAATDRYRYPGHKLASISR